MTRPQFAARTSQDITDTRIATLADLIRVRASERGPKRAIVYADRTLTYADLDQQSDRVAETLIALGLQPGERVALLDRNSERFFFVLFGAMKAGLALVPLNFRLAPKELAFILADSEASLIFLGAEFLPAVNAVRAQLTSLKTTVILDDAQNDETLETWMHVARPEPRTLSARAPQQSDIAIQMYTSGTTGQPKGVLLSHRAMIRSAVEGLSVWPAMFQDHAAVLATMPLFHIAACNLAIAALYAGGRTDVLRAASPQEIAHLIADHRITLAPLPAAVIHDMTKLEDIGSIDLSKLDTLLIAGSGIPVELLREAQHVLKCGFALSYGMTECCGGLSYLGPDDCVHDAGEKLKSAGKPLGSAQLKIADALGRDCAPGVLGEILCKTDRVMSGYWKRPEATAEVLKDGWYHSGDAGYLDEDGYVYVVDRIKDMVISGGENIYPAEIEGELVCHPDIDDAAVIGVPDVKWGEALVACLVLKPGAQLPDGIDAFLRARLAGYKVPRRFEVMEAFPRNASGKVLKRTLRELFGKPV